MRVDLCSLLVIAHDYIDTSTYMYIGVYSYGSLQRALPNVQIRADLFYKYL